MNEQLTKFRHLNNPIRQQIPIGPNDCFTFFSAVKKESDFPLHCHDDYELSLILDAKGAKRIVGNHVYIIDNVDLVLLGPNVSHTWQTHECKSLITEITIQWPKDLFDDKLLSRAQLCFLRKMLEMSLRGIAYSKDTIQNILPRIHLLNKKSGIDSLLDLISILHDLSVSRNMVTLSDESVLNRTKLKVSSRRLDKAFEFMNNNYNKHITLKDVSTQANMTEESFSRFIRKRSGKTFINSLNEIRIAHASRMLVDTTHFIREISFLCGFNNIANFNRSFKKKKGCTPKEYRMNFLEKVTVLYN